MSQKEGGASKSNLSSEEDPPFRPEDGAGGGIRRGEESVEDENMETDEVNGGGAPVAQNPGCSSDQPNPDDRYFCHVCNVAVTNVGQDFACPRCSNGFLEKIDTGRGGHVDQEQDEDHFHMGGQLPMNFLQNIMDAVLQHQGGIHAPPAPAAAAQQNPQAPPYLQFMQNLMQNLGNIQFQVQFADGEGGPMGFPLHGNPGDYAWGPGGIDNIVTQLLNQIEGGVPPMTEEMIKEIPTVEVTQKQVDNKVQCTTCMDEFSLKEKVKELPCRHCFHEDCIVPWLQRHDTCPICRKSADPTKWNKDRTQLLNENSPNTRQNVGTQNQAARTMMDTIDELD